MPIAPALARAVLAVDLIGDLDAVLAEIATEALDSHDARFEAGLDVTLDLSHVARFESDGVRDLARLVAARRLAGKSTELVVDNARLRSQLKAAGIVCIPATTRERAPGRHLMIARHAPR